MRLVMQTGLCLIILWFGLANSSSEVVVQAADKVKPIVYLTFDDGPSEQTKQVLAILKREGVKGTFFMLGKEVKRYPAIAKQVVQEGHAIGNHSYDHVYDELYSSFGTFAKQIMDTDDVIYKTIGVRTNLVRAPGGRLATSIKDILTRLRRLVTSLMTGT